MAESRLTAVVSTKGAVKAKSDLDKLTKSAGSAEKSFITTEKQSSGLSKGLDVVSDSAFDAAGAFGALGSAIGATAFLSKVVSVQREFDILNASITTFTGSAENAADAFTILEKFAAETPFALTQSVEAFNQLVALGLTPSEEALRSYGNTAAALGEDLSRMVEAVADASVGEFERLKAFGIKSSVEADKVKFTFRGVTQEIGNNAAEIEGYLIDLGQNEFAGAMQERMETLDGAISNLGDSWDSLFREISKNSIGDAIEESARIGTDAIEGLESAIRILFGTGKTENELDRQIQGTANNIKVLRMQLEETKKFGGGLGAAFGFATSREDLVAELDVLIDKQEELFDARRKLQEEAKPLESLVPETETGGGGTADTSEAKTAEREARKLQLAQDRIDQQVEAIRTGLLSEEEALLQSTLNQAELISQSTLSEGEQAQLRLDIWDSYYTQLADKNKEANDQITAENEKNAKLNEIIANQQQTAQLTALDNTTSSLKSTLGEQSSIYKAAAITQATIDTYTAANGAYSALASIPYVGPALGAAAAGVAIGAGLANVNAITSARHTGGDLAAGQASTIAEQGQLEVIAPSSNSRVRTKQQMQQLMNGSGGGNNQPNISIVNIDQTSGGVSVESSTDDEGRIIQIVRDTVTADLQNNTTQIAKARKSTSGQAGF